MNHIESPQAPILDTEDAAAFFAGEIDLGPDLGIEEEDEEEAATTLISYHDDLLAEIRRLSAESPDEDDAEVRRMALRELIRDASMGPEEDDLSLDRMSGVELAELLRDKPAEWAAATALGIGAVLIGAMVWLAFV